MWWVFIRLTPNWWSAESMDWEASSRCRRNYEPRSFGSVPGPTPIFSNMVYSAMWHCYVLFFFLPKFALACFSYGGFYFKSRGGRLQNLWGNVANVSAGAWSHMLLAGVAGGGRDKNIVAIKAKWDSRVKMSSILGQVNVVMWVQIRCLGSDWQSQAIFFPTSFCGVLIWSRVPRSCRSRRILL